MLIYSKTAYKKLFDFWKEKNYNTHNGDFSSWMVWTRQWEPTFAKAQFKEMKEHRMNKLDCAIGPCSLTCSTDNWANHSQCEAVPNMIQAIGAKGWVISDEMIVQETETKKMYTEDKRTEAQQAKNYLIKSLEKAIWSKEEPLMEAFGLRQKQPKNIGELKQMFADGWFQLDAGKRDDSQPIYSWSDYLKFSDPKVKVDEKGYHEAWKQVTAEASDVKDVIVVLGPEKGLEALNAFKAKTFH